MTENQKETIKRALKFAAVTAKNKAVSAYNSDLVQHFIEEYTGKKLLEKLKKGAVRVAECSKDSYEFIKPRAKIAKKKTIEASKRFLKFTKEGVKSAKNSQLYQDFKKSSLYKNCSKYGKKVLLISSLAGVMTFGGKMLKNHMNYINSDTHKYEICKENQSLLLLSIVHSEDWSDSSYNDGAGVPTIGYGTTVYQSGKKVKLNDKDISRTLSREELNNSKGNALDAAFLKGEKEVVSHLNKYVYPSMMKVKDFRKLKQNEQIALALFCYNIGCSAFNNSSVLREINEGNKEEAFYNMLKYNKITDTKTGRLVYAKGLQKRRTYEYMIAKGDLPIAEVLDMPIASIYSDAAYFEMYKGKTAKDFAGERVVIPQGDTAKYLKELKKDNGNKKVREMINSQTCADVECKIKTAKINSFKHVEKPRIL